MTENEQKFNNIVELKNEEAANDINTAIEKIISGFENMDLDSLTDEELAMQVLSMPDEEFKIVSEFLLNTLEEMLKNTDTNYTLVQAMNVSGLTVEGLREGFSQFLAQLKQESETLEKETGIKLSPVKEDFLKRFGVLFVNAVSEAEGVAKKIIEIPIKLEEGAKNPNYAHIGDAGADLYACIDEDIVIKPGETKIIPTGFYIAIPKGYELQIRPRSGMCSKTKLRVANTPGTIDSGYRGMVGVIVENIASPIKDITYEIDNNGHLIVTSILYGEDYTIHNGDRIAQAVLSEVPVAAFINVDELPSLDDGRDEGGFGSTGV